MWPKENREIYDMKVFAISFLCEYLGETFKSYETHQIECKYFDKYSLQYRLC